MMQTGIGGTNEHMYVCMYKLELKLNYQSAISVFFITVHSAVTFAHSNRSISVASHNCTCLYKLSVSQWLILPPLKILTFPPESPCTHSTIQTGTLWTHCREINWGMHDLMLSWLWFWKILLSGMWDGSAW